MPSNQGMSMKFSMRSRMAVMLLAVLVGSPFVLAGDAKNLKSEAVAKDLVPTALAGTAKRATPSGQVMHAIDCLIKKWDAKDQKFKVLSASVVRALLEQDTGITVYTTRPIVGAVRSIYGQDDTVVQELKDGTIVELKLLQDRKGWVTIDATIGTTEKFKLSLKSVAVTDKRQTARVYTRNHQLVHRPPRAITLAAL